MNEYLTANQGKDFDFDSRTNTVSIGTKKSLTVNLTNNTDNQTISKNKASIDSFSVFSIGPSVATGTGGHRNIRSINSYCGRFIYHIRFIDFLHEDKNNSESYNKNLYKFLKKNVLK